jgi:redox-sensitive bicupin YhaK (pirin superfamily)
VRLLTTLLAEGRERVLELEPGRQAWVHVARGVTSLRGQPLSEGDGVAVNGNESLTFEGGDAELLAFDLA